MKDLGVFVLLLGILIGFGAIVMDTTIKTEAVYVLGNLVGGGRVHNIGLMQRQQMLMAAAGIMILSGIIVALVGGRSDAAVTAGADLSNEGKCPFCSELVKIEAKLCRHCRSELPAAKQGQAPVHATCPSCECPLTLGASERIARRFACTGCQAEHPF